MAVELSIIVPARGRGNDLRECLRSLYSQNTTANYEVLAVFCERDIEVGMVVKDYEAVQVVCSPEFILAGPARNLGAKYARGDVLAFVDSDCILAPNWVSAALETIRAGAVLCSGAISDATPWHLISSSDNRLQYADFPAGRPYGTATYFPGAHIIMQKEIFEAGPGFSDSSQAQDVLLTMAIAQQFPQRTIFNPKIMASHAGRRTWKGLLRHHYQFGYSRAQHQIQMKGVMMFIAGHPWLGWVLYVRRFAYISLRLIQWDLRSFGRYFLQLPFILTGLAAWTCGFYKGMQEKHIGPD
jgi:mycofactocin glycosyltransferase